MNKILNKFGDTSLRVKNQIKFYHQILSYIFDDNEKNKNFIDYKEVWKWISKDVLSYKDKKIDHSKFWISVLKKFNLIDFKNGKVNLTVLGNSVLEISNKLNEKKFDAIAVIWFFLMLNSHKDLSNNFREFVKDLYDDKSIGIDKLIKKFIDPTPKKIHFSQKQIKLILEENSLQVVFNLRKKSKVNEYLPHLINNLNDKEKIIQILDENKKLKDELKKSCQKYMVLAHKKRINDSELMEYIYNRKEKLIQDIYILIKHRTVSKDYYDINGRWFTQSHLLKFENKNNGKQLVIDENYKKIFRELLYIKFDENLNEFENFVFKKNTSIAIKKYPFNYIELIEMFKFINSNKWLELKNKYDLENISNATIFEYIVNLSFYISTNKNTDEFREHCNTLLDDNLKPYSHATGGKSDGTIKSNDLCSTIEASILDNLKSLIDNEYTSNQKHAVNYYDSIISSLSKLQEYPLIIFVIKKDLDGPTINNFITYNKCKYFNDENISIKTMLLSCQDMINFMQKKKLKNVFDLYNRLPIKGDFNNENLTNFYKKLLNEI